MSVATNQCYFCSEVANLIHMGTNSLIIETVYIEFTQLISELMQIKIDDDPSNSMICISCKDHLSQFYVMKQQASKRLTPNEIRKLQIIGTLEEFLDASSSDCIISRQPNIFAVHPDTNSIAFDEALQQLSFLLNNDPSPIHAVGFNELEVEPEEVFSKENLDIIQYEEVPEEGVYDLLNSEEQQESIDKLEPVTAQPRPKKYQKSTLDPKQREWVRKELKESSVVLGTSFGNKTQWSCKQCSFKSFCSESTFRMHLKTHLDNPDIDLQEEPKANKIAKTEINIDEQHFLEQKMWINQQMLSHKEVLNTNEGLKTTWRCSQCGFVSAKRDRFRSHLQKMHTNILLRGPSKHSCFSCRLRFDGESHLSVHRNCHRIFDVIAPYAQYPECQGCKMFFCTAEDLQIHIERHKDKPDALQNPISVTGVVYKNGEAFFNEESEPDIQYENASTCGHCLMKFATDNECKHHLMLFHATFFTCPFDSRVFQGIPTLSFGNHLRQSHPDVFSDLEIACSFCKMQFETVYEKLAHMKKCNAKSFQCDHCEKSFFRKADLVNHLKVVTGLMVFACHFCGKRCKDQGDLKTHIRSHTNHRPYPCPHCDKSYKTSSARASHVESHMEQTHVCGVCNVKFRRRILYQRHMKLLHDEAYRQKCFAENTCNICNKSYLRKTHYKTHLKTHQHNVS